MSNASKTDALKIIEQSALTSDEKMMWTAVLDNQGEKAISSFFHGIGEDANLLRIATEFLKARLSSDELPPAGMLSKAEHDLIMEVLSLEAEQSERT